jgi:AraC family transcriptional regulator
MHAWESIQRVVDHIETHTKDEFHMESLAEIAFLSPYYFQRLFKRLLSKPVFEYIRLRRLAQSAEALKSEKRIVDVAMDYGFSSHANFTRAFKEAYGITPDEYRANPVHLRHVTKPELFLNYTLIDEGVPLITENIVIEITRKNLSTAEKYIGLSGKAAVEHATFGTATGIDNPGQLWEAFRKKKSSLTCILTGGIELGASSMGEDNDGTFNYFAGASAKADAPVLDGFTTWELPATEYVVCSFEAENFTELTTSALDKAMKYLFNTWFPNRKLAAQPFSAEKYFGSAEEGARMEIWVIPVPASEQQGS